MDKLSILKKFDELSLLHKVMLFIVIVGVMSGVYWYFVLDDTLIKITKVQKDIVKLDQDIKKFRTQVAQLGKLEGDLEARKKELYYARTLLPEDSRQLEMLLASFEQLGRDENVEFILFQPGAENIGEYYATRGVTLQISGTFHKLMTYFDRLTRLDRLVSIQSITFTPIKDFSPTEKVLRADLSLLVYRALTEQEIKARDAQKKKKKK